MADHFTCDDCTASFGHPGDAERHEQHTDHTVNRVPDRHERDVAESRRLDAQAPRGKRERMLDAYGTPRGDY